MKTSRSVLTMILAIAAIVISLGVVLNENRKSNQPSAGREQTGVVLAAKPVSGGCQFHLQPDAPAPGKPKPKAYWTKFVYRPGTCAINLPKGAQYTKRAHYTQRPDGTLRYEQRGDYRAKPKHSLPAGMRQTPEHFCQMSALTSSLVGIGNHLIYPRQIDCKRYDDGHYADLNSQGMAVTVVEDGPWLKPYPRPSATKK